MPEKFHFVTGSKIEYQRVQLSADQNDWHKVFNIGEGLLVIVAENDENGVIYCGVARKLFWTRDSCKFEVLEGYDAASQDDGFFMGCQIAEKYASLKAG